MSGSTPFEQFTQDANVILELHCGNRPARPPATNARPDFSDEIWRLIQRCWANHPNDRPSTDDVVHALEPTTPDLSLSDFNHISIHISGSFRPSPSLGTSQPHPPNQMVCDDFPLSLLVLMSSRS
jgi:hypothetical protein